MGYRWECLECDYISWQEDGLKKNQRHDVITGHEVIGGTNYWKHPNGIYFRQLRISYGQPELINKEPKLCQRCGETQQYVVLDIDKGGQVWFCKYYHPPHLYEDYPSGMKL